MSYSFFIEEINHNIDDQDLNTFSNIRTNSQTLFQFCCDQMYTTGVTMASKQVQQSGGVR